ncbi:MAG TPA: DNA adenine methylase [Anaerolineaceae bacterium]|nr:DNA adenine methylase [Anaerolineaceae bacterium]
MKWAGGKGQLLNELRKKYPKELGRSIRKYAEPFVGGGAVLFDILNNYALDQVYISDINAELINTYKVLKGEPDKLIKLLYQFQSEFIPLSLDERKKYYYEKRDIFNKLNKQKSNQVELAAIFIFLNRTCFNGLYRVNSKGEFNVPMGSYKNPLICDSKNLLKVSRGLKNVQIVCADYLESDSFIDENTFVYFDPPYRPLNASSSFTAYTKDSFSDEDQAELATFITRLSARGSYILASNSDPKNVNPEDDFFEELYSKLAIKRVSATRIINSDASLRGKINELLISSH